MEIPTPCPHCGKELKLTWSQIKVGNEIECENCLKIITLSKEDVKQLFDIKKIAESITEGLEFKL
ncbi:MAG: phage terminase large subunit family protein [Desulfobacula sp.]|nr:phage terminase large subunit family protein [Desulfobacula sp.]